MESPSDAVGRVLAALDRLEIPYLAGGSSAKDPCVAVDAGGISICKKRERAKFLKVDDLLEKLLAEAAR